MIRIFAIILLFSSMSLSGCGDDGDGPTPLISLRFVEVIEGNTGNKTAEVQVKLDVPAEEEIVLNYFTKDSTAIAASDYEAIEAGVLNIPPGITEITFPVTIISDRKLEFTEIFTLQFDQPVNAQLSASFITVRILDDDEKDIVKEADGYITPESYEDMVLVWQDEFNGPEIDMNNWSFEFGATGWGNEELQNYTDNQENARIEDGHLVITAIKQGTDSYTSARMITKDKQEFTFGRIDIRAKIPEGQGIWPALWMLGANIDDVGWPSCGEIDIMELVGHIPYQVHGTAHFNDSGHRYTGASYSINSSQTFGDEFHVFSVVWEHNRIRWFVDYNEFFELNEKMTGVQYPFNAPHFFIFNVAVGGRWPGYPDETTVFPQSMIVDYIRVFRPE